jgi:uncharacterized protein (TIGR03546 family)
MLIRAIAKVLVAINSNQRAGEIASAVALGFLLALIPAGNLLWWFILILTLFLKINLAAELLSLALFKLIAPLFDGTLHEVGYSVLTTTFLQGLFTSFYNIPIIPFTRFNNSVVMGGLIVGLVLLVPLYLLFKWLVRLYRQRIRDRIANSKIVKAFQRLPIVSTVIKGIRKLLGIYPFAR